MSVAAGWKSKRLHRAIITSQRRRAFGVKNSSSEMGSSREPAVQTFLGSMERHRVFDGKFTSIFSLMRDGRELAEALRNAREHINNGWARVLASVVDPYLEFVQSDEDICTLTGLG